MTATNPGETAGSIAAQSGDRLVELWLWAIASLVFAMVVVGGATLEPGFKPLQSGYAVSLPAGTTSAVLTATTTSSRASLTMNNRPATTDVPQVIELSGRETRVSLAVLAPDGQTKRSYTITIVAG